MMRKSGIVMNIIKIVTFNLRCDYGVDGENNFEFRKPHILQKMYVEKPDVVCFQEVMPHMADWLTAVLHDYNVVGCGRDADLSGEQVSIAYRKDRFSLVALQHFWLSDTPHVAGSRFHEQCDLPRLCTECFVMEKESNRVIRVVNTHLDHLSAHVREKQLRLVMKTIETTSMYKESITFLTGDFNAEPTSNEMRMMNDYPNFICLSDNIGLTYHGYFKDDGVSKHDLGPQIDYVYVKGSVKLLSVEKWIDESDGVYLSDHYPVCAAITWGKG